MSSIHDKQPMYKIDPNSRGEEEYRRRLSGYVASNYVSSTIRVSMKCLHSRTGGQ